MAESVDTSSPPEMGRIYVSCTPCRRSGQQVRPVKFCPDCDEYFCSACLVYHQKFPSMKDHAVLNIDESGMSYRAVFLRDVKLGVPTDTKPIGDIPSILRLADGRFIVCDWYNKALKMLQGDDYTVVGSLQLSDKPHTVCLVSENEVAVTLRDRKEVVFVSVDKAMTISMRTPVTTSEVCRGAVFLNGELYVASGGYARNNETPGKVEVYAISGSRFIEKDAGGQRMFRSPRAFAVNVSGSEINVTDFSKGVVTINPTGNIVRRFSDPDLDGARGICMGDEENIFVAGERSNNVVMIGKDGSKKVILSQSDGVVKPVSVCFDPMMKRLLIGMHDRHAMRVYQLE